MEAILKSHSILADVEDHGHGSHPGGYYSHARCVISERDERYRCYVHCTKGSDQGYYEEGSSYETCGRGDSIGSAINSCRAELSSDDRLSYAAKQALSTAYDEAEENEASDCEITYDHPPSE